MTTIQPKKIKTVLQTVVIQYCVCVCSGSGITPQWWGCVGGAVAKTEWGVARSTRALWTGAEKGSAHSGGHGANPWSGKCQIHAHTL